MLGSLGQANVVILAGMTWIVCMSGVASATAAPEPATIHIRCEARPDSPQHGVRTSGVQRSGMVPGELLAPEPQTNTGSWQFDGRTSIAYAAPSDAPGFAENFTWEGFFLLPAANGTHAETGISDRLVTQFAFARGDWTRLAIGLVAHQDGSPRLSVSLEGFDGRTFGVGDRGVSTERWHHFALVHEGTAAAARIRWYLDYTLTGEIFLGGQANQNTLRPPGAAHFTIGARRIQGGQVNRGFAGFIDEVRLVPRPLNVGDFLRCTGSTLERIADTEHATASPLEVFWTNRHRWARDASARWAPGREAPASIDAIWPQSTLPPLDDAAFLRRLSLTVRGRIPSLGEVTSFLADQRSDKRARVIDLFLNSPEWADAWVGYWQDVLAENPSVVFPTLNNSGAFRQWIYESFRDNMALDRFATELILMKSSEAAADRDDGPAGFALATGNDAPMAMRSHVAMKAFAAVDLTCARCHDSPVDDFQQADLFLLAAYLNGGPLEVPATSVAAVANANATGAITTSLVAGQVIAPQGLRSHWLRASEDATSLQPIQAGTRAELAALLTSPHNSRFSDVIVNRVWQRFFGVGLIEPVDHWPAGQETSGRERERPGDVTQHADGVSDLWDTAHRKLLRLLSAEFVASGYDLLQLSRRILMSQAWQRQRERRRLMSAEQLVDSLFLAVGKDFQAETMGVHATDAGAVQLPRPMRAWQFAALPNERDRPALGMPVNQTIVDVMTTFGWIGNRQQPRSVREQTISAQQPLLLFNGLMAQRIVRLSDRSAITELSLEDIPASQFVERLFLCVLGRLPSDLERQALVDHLGPSYTQRRTGKPIRSHEPLTTFQPDWRKHLEAEQTHLMLAAQRRVARGEPPTDRLTEDFRERAEDILWALMNSPEFVVVP